LFCLAALAAAPAVAQQPMRASVNVGPVARALFERDWVLMNWALKFYDRDRDVLLSPAEAEAAAGEFRRVADANRDGRVSTDEYRAARASILARY
jgi:hypothetical protein